MNFKLKAAGIFAGLFGLTLLTSAVSPENIPLEVGNRVPEFFISKSDGEPFLLSRMHGESLVLNFWSVKDAESRIQNIRLARNAERNGEKYIGLCTDSDRRLAEEVMRADGIDPEMQYFVAPQALQTLGCSASLGTVKIDPSGNIAEID